MAIDNDNDTVVQLKNYPIKFDSTSLTFFPSSWGRQLKKITNTQQSEGGVDIVQVIRTKKISYPITVAVADDSWVDFFEEYYEKESFTLSVYSPRVGGYEEKTVRMDSLDIKPRRHSEDLTEVTGVWDVTFTIEEF